MFFSAFREKKMSSFWRIISVSIKAVWGGDEKTTSHLWIIDTCPSAASSSLGGGRTSPHIEARERTKSMGRSGKRVNSFFFFSLSLIQLGTPGLTSTKFDLLCSPISSRMKWRTARPTASLLLFSWMSAKKKALYRPFIKGYREVHKAVEDRGSFLLRILSLCARAWRHLFTFLKHLLLHRCTSCMMALLSLRMCTT